MGLGADAHSGFRGGDGVWGRWRQKRTGSGSGNGGFGRPAPDAACDCQDGRTDGRGIKLRESCYHGIGNHTIRYTTSAVTAFNGYEFIHQLTLSAPVTPVNLGRKLVTKATAVQEKMKLNIAPKKKKGNLIRTLGILFSRERVLRKMYACTNCFCASSVWPSCGA